MWGYRQTRWHEVVQRRMAMSALHEHRGCAPTEFRGFGVQRVIAHSGCQTIALVRWIPPGIPLPQHAGAFPALAASASRS